MKRITDEAKAELRRLAEADKLTAAEVLAAAEHHDNPLHEYFEWDDSAAAHQYRLNQSRNLVAQVRVELVEPEQHEVTVRAYVPVEPIGRYVPMEEAVENWRDELVSYARRDLRYWCNKYRHLGLDTLRELMAELE